jgi:hypothetical protein
MKEEINNGETLEDRRRIWDRNKLLQSVSTTLEAATWGVRAYERTVDAWHTHLAFTRSRSELDDIALRLLSIAQTRGMGDEIVFNVYDPRFPSLNSPAS